MCTAHIGDFTLFMTGLFPEYLRRLKSVGRIYHKDFLVDYVKTGKRSYGLVAEYGRYDPEQDSPLFRKLSENFELCVTGLGFVRSDFDRMQDPTCRRVKDSAAQLTRITTDPSHPWWRGAPRHDRRSSGVSLRPPWPRGIRLLMAGDPGAFSR
jgi:hypothetical protein